MKATRLLKVKSVLAIVLIAVELFAQLTAFHTHALAAPALALPDGMSLGAQLTQDDLAYLQDNLQYLRDQLPDWWQYVAEATPVTLALDSSLDANGRAAVADCCDEHGNGLISGSSDRTMRVHALRIEDLVALERSRLTRSLTTEECRKYLHVETCPAAPWQSNVLTHKPSLRLQRGLAHLQYPIPDLQLLQHHRNHHRPALGLAVEVFAERVFHLVA